VLSLAPASHVTSRGFCEGPFRRLAEDRFIEDPPLGRLEDFFGVGSDASASACVNTAAVVDATDAVDATGVLLESEGHGLAFM